MDIGLNYCLKLYLQKLTNIQEASIIEFGNNWDHINNVGSSSIKRYDEV